MYPTALEASASSLCSETYSFCGTRLSIVEGDLSVTYHNAFSLKLSSNARRFRTQRGCSHLYVRRATV